MTRSFDEVYASVYDDLYANKDYAREADELLAVLGHYSAIPAKHLLDLGCGTGRHAHALGRRGYSVVGVDRSAAMLAIAATRNPGMDLIRANVEDFDYRSRDGFDAAFLGFAVLSYLNGDGGLVAGLRNIARHLKPEALLVGSFWWTDAVAATPPSPRQAMIERPDGAWTRVARSVVDPENRRVDVEYTLTSEREVVAQEVHRMTHHDQRTLTLGLEKAGFETLEFGGWPLQGTPMPTDSYEAWVVARRR